MQTKFLNALIDYINSLHQKGYDVNTITEKLFEVIDFEADVTESEKFTTYMEMGHFVEKVLHSGCAKH